MSETCLCSHISGHPEKNAATVVPIIQAFARNHMVSDTLLFCVWRLNLEREAGSVFAAVLHGWKQHHPSLHAELLALEERGAAAVIDTLCRIFDREEGLDAHLLLRWVDAKRVLDDYASIPALFCRIVTETPRLAPLVLDRFGTLLDESPASRADTLLREFARCLPGGIAVDTVALRSWIIGQYGRKGLFERQLAMAASLEKDTARLVATLASIARERCMLGQYFSAAAAARLLYHLAAVPQMQREAASLLQQAYRGLGMSDSASVWLERAGTASEKDRIEAIELYQRAGKYAKAAPLLSSLPQSLAHDTLSLRQLLLRDSAQAALQFIGNERNALHRSEQHLLLWRIRANLYAGKTDVCLALLDSVKLNPAYPFAAEFMDYRYWLLRFADRPEALAKFSQIEYTLFKGDRGEAAQLLCKARLEDGAAWRIAVRIARRQLAQSEAAAAVATLQCAPAEGEPEYLYCMADARFRSGDRRVARTMLERLILEFPASIYSTKGRLLLSRIP